MENYKNLKRKHKTKSKNRPSKANDRHSPGGDAVGTIDGDAVGMLVGISVGPPCPQVRIQAASITEPVAKYALQLNVPSG